MGRTKKGRPDVDRGRAPRTKKVARFVSEEEGQERDAEREGLRDLGRRAAQMPGRHHAQIESDQIIPQSASQPLGHPAKARQAPAEGEVATPISSRQKDARSKTRTEAMRAAPQTELKDLRALVGDGQSWGDVNDALSETVGDVDRLPPRVRQLVRRNDRFIRRYERRNDRQHLVYACAEMLPSINHSNIEGHLRKRFGPGTVQNFDRYTMGTHQAHESFDAASDIPEGRKVMFRMRTNRGAYLGQSGRKDNTAHLMPRGLKMVVTDVRQETFQRPDGSTETAWVVDLQDAPEDLDTDTTERN